MKIKFLVSMAGSEWAYSPGQVAEIEQAEAVRLVEAGFAVPVVDAAETAVVKPAEKRGKK